MTSVANSRRLRRDVDILCREPPTGIRASPDENDLQKIHALIIGPDGTPYQGGYFLFSLVCPPTYPFKPPAVKLLTTDAGKVRFNPNLYKDGKVCLSLLGTWTGPEWSPAQTLTTCLISIQSIMNELPYHNEPGFAKERVAGEAERYNEVIRHETLRVAVCGMLEGETKLSVPATLVDAMWAHFRQHYDSFVTAANQGMANEGKPMKDPFGGNAGKFNYKKIISRLEALYKCNQH